MIYIYSFLFCIYFAILVNIRKDHKKVFKGKIEKIFIMLTFLPLFVLYAFRGEVGIDHQSYQEIFNVVQYSNLKELPKLSDKIEIETFFLFINYLGSKWGFGINFVYFICSALTFLFIYKAITYYDNERKYFIMSIIIFYSQMFFSGLDAVRQIVAIAIYFYSTKYISERKLYLFLIWLFIASLFHSSVLLLLPTYFILRMRIKPILYIIISVAFLLLSKVFTPVILIESVSSIFPNWKYLSDIYNDVQYGETIGSVYFIHLVTSSVFLIYQKKVGSNNKEIIPINMYVLYTMLYPLISPFLSTKRLLYYLFIGICLGIPFGIERLKDSKLAKYRLLISIIYGLLFILLFLSSVKSGYSNPQWYHEPYKFMKQ